MTLRLLGHIEMPAHRSEGGFDHADVHAPTDRLYVAHTANDAIDVIDCANGAAYLAEIFRAGIAAIHQGQSEAALSLGILPGDVTWFEGVGHSASIAAELSHEGM